MTFRIVTHSPTCFEIVGSTRPLFPGDIHNHSSYGVYSTEADAHAELHLIREVA